MASFAILPKASIMDIITRMTVVAGTRQTHLLHRLRMTRVALQALVFSRQRKICLAIVIEVPVFPASRTMAGLALDTQASTVFVIFSMTSDTGNRGILKALRSVAVFTFHLHMPTEQWKRSQSMIEQSAFPGGFVVATVALFAFLALVYIILTVARVAGFTQVFLAKDTLVAGSTLDLIVLTP